MSFLKRRSLSRQMFISSLAIIGFVLAVFSAFSIQLLRKNYDQEEQRIIRDKLAKCCRIADISFGYLDQSAQMMTSDPEIIRTVVAPDHNQVERSITVMSMLGNVVRSNEMVSRAALYLEYDHSVYTSEMSEAHVSTDKELNFPG